MSRYWMHMEKSCICKPSHRVRRGSGFTLLEMSIVLIIISVVASGAMIVFANSLAVRQVNDTKAKLATIQTALYDYRVANDRLPCPTDATLALTDTNFGVEATGQGNCAGTTPGVNANQSTASVTGNTINGSANVTGLSSTAGLSQGMGVMGAGIPTGDIIASISGTQITLTPYTATATASGITLTFAQTVEGMVPVRTLRLPDDYAFDSWGRRIMYAVSKDMTQTDAFTIFPASDTTTRMTMLNPAGEFTAAPDTAYAAYVLLSFGPNGHGGYPRSGNTIARLSASSVNTDELQNCDCDSNAVTTGLNGVFVQKDPTLDSTNRLDGFDDIVVYATRANLALQSTMYWGAVGNSSGVLCPQNTLSCTMVGATKSCTCDQ